MATSLEQVSKQKRSENARNDRRAYFRRRRAASYCALAMAVREQVYQ